MGSPPAKFDHSQFEYNGRPFTNHEPRFFLGLRCGIPPGQTQDGMTTVCHSSYILAMHRIHAGSPRASPYKSHTGDKNYAAHSCSCRGFRVGSPPAKFDHSLIEYNGRPFTNHEPRTTSHDFFHKPKVTRSDVVNLSLLPRSGI